jgi:hypothetical protein
VNAGRFQILSLDGAASTARSRQSRSSVGRCGVRKRYTSSAPGIENRHGTWWVSNPAQEEENFADKWNEHPERREAFLAWHCDITGLLVEDLPEEEVLAAVAELRLRTAVTLDREWPPAWFGAASAGRTDVAARSEELLEDGFGRSA